MKKIILLLAVLALAVSVPALACGKAGCPMGMKNAEKSATNIDNGVKITFTAKDAAQVKAIQAALADEMKDSDCDCPMHAKGVTRAVENTDKGAVLTLTSADKDQVTKLQAMAAEGCKHKGEMKSGKGMGDCPMHKKTAAGDHA